MFPVIQRAFVCPCMVFIMQTCIYTHTHTKVGVRAYAPVFYQHEMHSWDISVPPAAQVTHGATTLLPNTTLSKGKTERPHALSYHTAQNSSRPSSAGRSVTAFWCSLTVYDNLAHAYAVLSDHLLLSHLLYTRKNRYCTWKTWDWQEGGCSMYHCASGNPSYQSCWLALTDSQVCQEFCNDHSPTAPTPHMPLQQKEPFEQEADNLLFMTIHSISESTFLSLTVIEQLQKHKPITPPASVCPHQSPPQCWVLSCSLGGPAGAVATGWPPSRCSRAAQPIMEPAGHTVAVCIYSLPCFFTETSSPWLLTAQNAPLSQQRSLHGQDIKKIPLGSE